MTRIITGLTAGVLTGILSACSLFGPTEAPRKTQTVNSEKALDFFVEGVTQESLGNPDLAMDYYRQSLTYDSTTIRSATTYYNMARVLAGSKQPELALQYAVASVRLDSAGQDYRVLLARLYFENTLYQEAAAEYQRLVDQDPDNPEYWYRLAISYQISRKITESLKTFDEYIRRFGEDYHVRMQQLMILDARNERSQVVRILQSMIADDPDNLSIRQLLSAEYVKADQLDSAIVTLKPILDYQPDRAEVLLNLSELEFRNNRPDSSKAWLTRLFTTETISDDEILAAGQIFAEAGKNDSITAGFAVLMFSELERMRPTDWRPTWFMGVQDLIRKEFTQAATRFETVVRLNPDLVQGWQNLALSYMQGQQYTLVSDRLTEGLKRHGLDFQLNFFKGFSAFQLNQDSVAIHFLQRANQINPYQTDPMAVLASAYERNQLFSKSDSLFERILIIDPTDATVLNNFAYSLSERAIRLDDARRMSELSLKSEPDNAAFLDTYGWIRYQQGDFTKAEYYIRRSIETGDASAVVLEHLGDVYLALGRLPDAIHWWEKALVKEPGKPSIQQKLSNNRQ